MKHICWPLLLLPLAACTGGGATPESLTERTTIEACREQANTAFNMQNRDQIYREYQPFSPSSSIGLTQNPTQGLSDRFTLQRSIQNCIRNTGTGANRSTSGASSVGGPSVVAPGTSLSR